MVAKDEDASLTQLCSGWLYLAIGGDKLQEAFYIFTEMAEKNCKTPLLSVGLASVLIAQGTEYIENLNRERESIASFIGSTSARGFPSQAL